MPLTGAEILLALVTAERLAELWLARRNTAALIAAGGHEAAPGHYPLIVLLHAAWLAGLWWLARDHPLQYLWLGLFLALQGLRVWTLASLGRRWTTRIIVVPGERLVARGPYRFIRHPNYLVVVGEIACLPVALRAPLFALTFSLANAALLWIRIRAENAALAGAPS
jgi:methyltransferase